MQKAFLQGKPYTPATRSETLEYLVGMFSKEPERCNDEMIERWESLGDIDAETKIKQNVLQ